MRRRRLVRIGSLAALGALGAGTLFAQTGPSRLTSKYGRATIEVDLSHAQPGGVLGVIVRGGRWASASTLLDGRRGALNSTAGALAGLIPVALDTPAGDHKLSIYFPGGRRGGGSTVVMVPVSPLSRPGRVRPLSPEAFAVANSQAALGHGRFLLAAIRSRDPQNYQVGPLRPPVDQPIAFPFGGEENWGMVMGPVKDGLIGEQHRGVDYEVPAGTPVKAPGLGIVLLARSLAFSGETVALAHGNGLVSVLAHLTRVRVREGDVVKQGDVVGISGSTGIGALLPHLCFSVYLHSINVDPEAVMDPSLWPG